MRNTALIVRSVLVVSLTTLLSLAPARAWAASVVPPLTLGDVLTSVEGTHPDLETADRVLEEADGNTLAARGGFDPVLSLRGCWMPLGYYQSGQVDALVRQATPLWGASLYAGYRVGLGSYPQYKGELQTLSGGEVRAGIDVPIWRDGPIDRRRAKIQTAKILSKQARQARDATTLAVQRDAAERYWDWVAAGKRLDIARSLLAIAEQRDKGLSAQAEAGAIERIKLVDNQRLVLDRRAKVVSATRTFRDASLKLSLYLRDGELRPVVAEEERVPPGFPAPAQGVDSVSLEAEIDRALARRPDLAAMLSERDAATVDVRLAKNQRAPDVRLQAFVARDFGNGPAELQPTEFGAGVLVEMPLPLREARGELAAAKARRAGVDAQLRQLRDAIGAEIRAAHVALGAALQRVSLAREQVDAANVLADAERIRFEAGASELVIVNLRELQAADAASREVDAQADYQRALARFLVSTGRSPVT